ncbi:MAG: hypothetical protein PHC53_03030 [Patescibacteria group bacterium]|nr:hypothetical protein [Patescibacteria group bacterium]
MNPKLKKRLQWLACALVALWVLMVIVGEIVGMVMQGSIWLYAIAAILGLLAGYALSFLIERRRAPKKGVNQ